MSRRTPTTHDDERPRLRVLEGGLSLTGWQEDEPADALDATRLRAEMAAAAALCDQLEQDGLRISFDTDPAGGRVRASVMDAAGHPATDLPLAHVVSPAHLTPFMGATS